MKIRRKRRFSLLYVIFIILGVLIITMCHGPTEPDKLPVGRWGESQFDEVVYDE